MVDVDLDKLKIQITSEEGRKGKLYPDTLGIPTIGIGRNLRDVGLSEDEIDYLFQNDLARVKRDIERNMPWVFNLDEVRVRVFYDLVFNMGITRLLGFHNALAASREGNWDKAADEFRNSLWDKEVGGRAPKLETMLRTGEDQ